jgi:PAS domain S-box-containing protein/diguanylate cyclase (GGDEF)-like protein
MAIDAPSLLHLVHPGDAPLRGTEGLADDHAVLALDRSGRIREWSPGAERIGGYTRDEALGRHVSVFYPAEELRAGAPYREVEEAASGRVQAEGWWIRKDGSRMWGRRVLYPLRGSGGEAEGVGVVVCDLTAAREALRRLEEREECYRSLFEHTPDPACTLNAEGVVTGANAAFQALAGERDLAARPLHALLVPEHRRHAREAVARAARGEAQRATLALRSSHGQRVDVDAAFVPIYVAGQPSGVFAVCRDLTAPRREEERLRGSEARFRALVEECDSGFFYLLDGGGRLRYLSPSVRGVTGYAPEALLGRTLEDALGCEPVEGTLPGAPATCAVRTAGGETRLLELAEGEVADAEAGPGRRGFARDVTRQRTLERELAEGALYDAATGVAGRALFADHLRRALRLREREPGRRLALLAVELDRAAASGPDAADRVLAEAGRRLERCVRPGDSVGRGEGDTFLVLLDGIREPGDAARVARRIEAVLDEPFPAPAGETFAVTAVGIALAGPGRSDAGELLREAGAALRRARALPLARYGVVDDAGRAEASPAS